MFVNIPSLRNIAAGNIRAHIFPIINGHRMNRHPVKICRFTARTLDVRKPAHNFKILFKIDFYIVNAFYVSKNIYELGLIEIETPMGNKVRAYDIERCICDIIKSKNRMDLEHVKYSIKTYIKSKDKNIIKLSKYANEMGIKDEVMDYIGYFYE